MRLARVLELLLLLGDRLLPLLELVLELVLVAHLLFEDVVDGAQLRGAFLDLLFEQVRTHDTTLLMVSHDPRLSDRFDRVLRIDEVAQIERRAA